MKNSTEQNADESRLVGWLVSYGLDDNGAAFEIRAGRSLISSAALSATATAAASEHGTITIDEASIQAPHLAVSASNKHRVLVQDIFTNSGSFLVKGLNGEERKITGPVEVDHGDWIRVGESTRFQVCLIDGPRR